LKKLCCISGLLGWVLCASALAWARPGYLIRIDRMDRASVDLLANTEVEVYAKAGEFWIAGTSAGGLQYLAETGMEYHLLDKRADAGDHYLIWTTWGEDIGPGLTGEGHGFRVLFAEKNVAVVKGSSREIEKLGFLGFDLKKVRKKPLPLKMKPFESAYLPSVSTQYDPLIEALLDRIDLAQLYSWTNDFTGEDTVIIDGIEDSIKTRYSWSKGVFKAAHYLKERFEEMGLSAEFDTFQVGSPTAYLLDVCCSPDGQKAWSVSLGGGIIKTTDGGNEWCLVEDTEGLCLWDVCRVDDDVLWAVGNRGVIVTSDDGGNTWESRSEPGFAEHDFMGCHFESENRGWVVGDERILFTSDGGTNWTEQMLVEEVDLYDIDFADSCRGWAVGEHGTVLRTTDGGIDWSPQATGTSVCLRSVDFVDFLNGWATGDDGWAIYTTDGGLLWTRKALPTTARLSNINFVGSSSGWMVGLDGSIFHTSDLGVDWVPQTSHSHYLCGVEFADSLTGWVSGHHDLLKTTDGGENWYSQYENLRPPHLFNVVGTMEGLFYPDKQLLITAHYDDMSEEPEDRAPGADDNASGVISLLAAASVLKDCEPAYTLKFVAFSGEEQGLLGSAAYAEAAFERGDSILGVLNCDMIAYDGNADRIMELHSGLAAENQTLAHIFMGAVSDYGLNLVPQKITDGASHSSDHASFWDYGFPAVLAHQDYQDRNPYMHTTGDVVSAFDSAYYVDFVKAAVACMSILGDPFVRGDASRDGTVDLEDVVHLLNYLFKEGPSPQPLPSGDVNCDQTVDLADVVHLLNYLFRAGLPPGC
jgi:photosystem II stability/assembly factor-like uncharacterized protein